MSSAAPPRAPAAPGLLIGATVTAVLHFALLLGDSLRTDEALTLDDPWIYLAYKADQLLRVSLAVPVFAVTLHALGYLRHTGAWRLAATAALSIGCALLATAISGSLL